MDSDATEYSSSDSSGTDDDLPPKPQNIGARGGQVRGQGRTAFAGKLSHSDSHMNMEGQIHQIEQEAYISVLRAFNAQSESITWEKESLISELRNELRISNDEHRELLSKVNADVKIRRLRERRVSGGIQSNLSNGVQPIHNIPNTTITVPHKKQMISQSVPSQNFEPLTTAKHSQTASTLKRGSQQPVAKSKKARYESSAKFIQYPSTTTPERGSAGAFASSDILKVPNLIGRKLCVRWPEDLNFYEGIITNYDFARGKHVIVYDKSTEKETVEFIDLNEISPNDIQWVGEYPGIYHAVGLGGPVRGTNKLVGQSGPFPGSRCCRESFKNQHKKNVPQSQNETCKKYLDDIELLSTVSLIREVENVFDSNNPDPVVMDKANKLLQDHEQSLIDALARIKGAIDLESGVNGLGMALPLPLATCQYGWRVRRVYPGKSCPSGEKLSITNSKKWTVDMLSYEDLKWTVDIYSHHIFRLSMSFDFSKKKNNTYLNPAKRKHGIQNPPFLPATSTSPIFPPFSAQSKIHLSPSMAPVVKKKNGRAALAVKKEKEKMNGQAREEGGGAREEDVPQGAMERRVLRSRYLDVKNQINDDRDTLCEADKFSSIIGQVESLHQHVQKPREQVADAEALLDIANSLVTTIKSYGNEGLTPTDFITRLIENFGQHDVVSSTQGRSDIISWTNVGLSVSHIFRSVPGCCTMLGPMTTEPKQRKATKPRKQPLPVSATTCPEEVEENESGKRTDTDKNMSTMFEILRKHRNVRLENLVLNRVSFAQTVENIFALSFLVKDGRASMTVRDSGHHIISPKNAPSAALVASGEVSFSHFIFRFDFLDWKFMLDTVSFGEELMPNRTSSLVTGCSQDEQVPMDSENIRLSTPIRKLSRNRGLVTQNCSVGNAVSNDDTSEQGCLAQKRRRLFRG